MELNTIVLVAEIILFAAITCLCVYLIISLKKVNKTLDSAQQNLNDLQEKTDHLVNKLSPVIDNLNVITSDIKEVSGSAKSQMAKVDGIVTSVKDTTDSIIRFEREAQRQIEGQVFDAINLVSAVVVGIKTFVSKIKGNSNGSYRPKKHKSYSSLSESEEDEY